MHLTKRTRLGHIPLVLYSLAAVSTTQSVSTLSNGCYLTSTIIFGNITTSSTTGQGQLSISPILTGSTTSLSARESIFPTTNNSPIPPSSPSLGTSELVFSPTSAPASLTSTAAAGLSTTVLAPTSTPFRIAVSGFNNKLHARSLTYISFSGNDAYLVPNEELSAIFVLTSDGRLHTGEATVGTNGETGSLPLMQFFGSTQPSEYIWSSNGTRLMLGDNLPFSALTDGQLYVTFPGSQPPSGAVNIVLEPEFVATASGSSSIGPTISSSALMSPSPSTEVMTMTSEATSMSSPGTIGATSVPGHPVSSTASAASSPGSSPATTSSSLHSTQTTPSGPSASSTAAHTSPISPSQSYSSAAPASPSPSPQSSSNSPSTVPASSPQGSTAALGISTSSPAAQGTNAQVSPTTQPSSTSRSTIAVGGVSSLSSSALPSAAASWSMSYSAATTISNGAPTSSIANSASVPPSSSSASSTSGAVSVASSQMFSTSLSTTSPPTQITTTSLSNSAIASPTFTTTTSKHGYNGTYTGPRTRTSSSSTSTSSPSPIPTPYPAKRGLAYTNVTTLQFYPPPSPYISWSYNYYSLPNASNDLGPYPYPSSPYRFIPLLYNDANSLTSIWSVNVNFSIQNYGTDAIFGFNEPDASYSGQSANMPVQESIAGYKNFMQPFAGRVKIGAPAVTNTGGGLSYLAQFLGNATQQNLTIDFINIHWYASPYNIDYFTQYLLQAYNLSLLYSPNITSSFTPTKSGGVLPVYVTEFGMDQNNYDLATTVQFMKNATLWMDEQLWVERYAWFGNFPGGLTSYGAPTTNMLLNTDGSGRSALGDTWYTYNGTN